MSNSEKYVLFADMLGFSDLVNKYPIDLNDMMVRSKPLSLENINKIYDGFSGMFGPKEIPAKRKRIKPKNRLSEMFVDFHESIKWILGIAKMKHSITAISFSDSLYVSTQDFFATVEIAVDLVHNLMKLAIPIRVGIALGSFASLNFSSDISLDGGEHSSQFLGTAVVRAHEAESCGIKGIRILLHHSILPHLENQINNPDVEVRSLKTFKVIKCSEEEQKNKTEIRHEINYWKFSTKSDAQNAWKGLQKMWGSAPEYALNHYLATAEAINRMRIANGEKPLNNLQRRALPQCTK